MSPRETHFDVVAELLEAATQDRVTPAAVVEVGSANGPDWRHVAGRLSYVADAAPAGERSVFDLASLTKVIATTTLAMRLHERGSLPLERPVSHWMPAWRHGTRSRIQVRHLLDHSSGLPALHPFYESCGGREDVRAAIEQMALDYEPGTRSVYSDPGFILLGLVLEDVAGRCLRLAFEEVRQLLGLEELQYGVSPERLEETAPTQVDSWRGRLLRGEVDDRNAAVLDGVAGHAGLFGTVAATGRFAQAMLSLRLGIQDERRVVLPATVQRFVARTETPGSSRALGWDRMLPTSSCGTRMSGEAFGHTGFTGTSIWIDPAHDVYVVLLTNRVHPVAGPSEGITRLRRAVHDAVMDAIERRRAGGRRDEPASRQG